jgi:ribosomal protein L44E
MRRSIYILAILGAAALPLVSGHGQPPDAVQKLMQRKLQFAQRVLEGIALNDFDKIADSAAELVEVSKAASWRVMKTPQYEVFSNDFRRNAEALGQLAKARNLDGAALAYVDLTLNCVKCHKYVRETRMVRLDGFERLSGNEP